MTFRTVVPGSAEGRVLKLKAPISFWGGVDPVTGAVCDPRHPDAGVEIAGRVLVVPDTVGSSSSSAIMLELLREGRAPAALVMARTDAILTLGVLVARELGYPTLPVLEVGRGGVDQVPDGARVRVVDGRIVPVGKADLSAEEPRSGDG